MVRAERAIVGKTGNILRNQTNLEIALAELVQRVLIGSSLLSLINVQTLSIIVVTDDGFAP